MPRHLSKHKHNDGEVVYELDHLTGPMLHDALGRLLGSGQASSAAITQFIHDAPHMGIDLDLIAATAIQRGSSSSAAGQSVHRKDMTICQACMPVLGAGRTVMLFVSGPGPVETLGSHTRQAAHRAWAIEAAIRVAGHAYPDRVNLIQALAMPHEDWAIEAYLLAGMRRIAELAYLAKPLTLGMAKPVRQHDGSIVCADGQPWPEGVSVRSLRSGSSEDRLLAQALEASYEETLDCPELAGMRSTSDIIDSHRAVGEYDPTLWWLVAYQGQPMGCVLLNRCPQTHAAVEGCVELVYIGIAPALRGCKLGQRLLDSAIAASASLERSIRCALDTRNTPARCMYDQLGFSATSTRVAFVALAQAIMARKS